MTLALLIGVALSALCTLSMALYLLNVVAVRLRRFADASTMMLNEVPFGVVILTRDPDSVVCNEVLAERLGLERDQFGIHEAAIALPQSYSVRRNPQLATLVHEIASCAPLDLPDASGSVRRWRRYVAEKQTERGLVRALALHELEDGPRVTSDHVLPAGLWDRLTGLANRTLLEDRAAQAIEVAARTNSATALLVIEIDQLAAVESGTGEDAAKRLLIEAAGRISAVGRAMETIAQIEPNRFAVLLKALDNDQPLVPIATRFLEAAKFDFLTEPDVSLAVTASIGAAISNRRGTTLTRLVAEAGMACRRAAAEGGNRIWTHAASDQAKTLAN